MTVVPEHAVPCGKFMLRSGREIVVATTTRSVRLSSCGQNGAVYSIVIPENLAEDFAAAVAQASARLSQRLPGWSEATVAGAPAHGWDSAAIAALAAVQS